MNIESLTTIGLAKFNFIIRFVIEKLPDSAGGFLCNVELMLIEKPTEAGPRLRLRLLESKDVHVGYVDGMVASLLTVYDVSDRGLEGIHYRVVDDESNFFSLYCRDIEFEVMSGDVIYPIESSEQ